MSVQTRLVVAVVVVLVVLAVFADHASAGYRKPPFNGSIFGKRAGADAFYGGDAKALYAACQVAIEACAAYIPNPEKK